MPDSMRAPTRTSNFISCQTACQLEAELAHLHLGLQCNGPHKAACNTEQLPIRGHACKDGKKKRSASSSCSSVNRIAPSHLGGFQPLAWSWGFSSCSRMHRGACSRLRSNTTRNAAGRREQLQACMVSRPVVLCCCQHMAMLVFVPSRAQHSGLALQRNGAGAYLEAEESYKLPALPLTNIPAPPQHLLMPLPMEPGHACQHALRLQGRACCPGHPPPE